MGVLLPFCYMVSTAKLGKQVTFDYKITTIISFGLLVQTVAWYLRLLTEKMSIAFNVLATLTPGIFTSFLVWICLKQTEFFSIICGIGTTLFYDFLYFYVLKRLPKSFTLGESAIVMQGITLFVFNAFLQLPSYYMKNGSIPTNELGTMKYILQIGLLGILILITMIHLVPLLQHWILFYPLILSFIALMISIPDAYNVPQIYTLIDFMTKDNERVSSLL